MQSTTTLLTNAESKRNLRALSKMIENGFGDSYVSGAIAMYRPVHGFFYAARFMVGGVFGYLRVCRFQNSVRQPDASPAAQSLATSDGGLKHIVLESIMAQLSYTIKPSKKHPYTLKIRFKSIFFIIDSNNKIIADSLTFDQAQFLSDQVPDSFIKFQKMESAQ